MGLKDPTATSLIFVDKIFGQTCKFEGLADDKKGAKIWMKDVVTKLSGNATKEAEPEVAKPVEATPKRLRQPLKRPRRVKKKWQKSQRKAPSRQSKVLKRLK